LEKKISQKRTQGHENRHYSLLILLITMYGKKPKKDALPIGKCPTHPS